MTDLPIFTDYNPYKTAFIDAVKTHEDELKQSPFYLMGLKNYPSYAAFTTDANLTPIEFKPAIISQWCYDNEHFKTDINTETLYYFIWAKLDK